jgi:hypothetical protein
VSKKLARLQEAERTGNRSRIRPVSYSCLLPVLKNTRRPDSWILITAVFHSPWVIRKQSRPFRPSLPALGLDPFPSGQCVRCCSDRLILTY